MNADEKRGYQRGYNAGRRKAAAVNREAARRRAENRMWLQVFCAALQGTIVNGNWSTGDEKWTVHRDYVRGCGNIANEAVKQHGHRAT